MEPKITIKILTLLLLLFCSGSAQAQDFMELDGYVYDPEMQPIEGANVSIREWQIIAPTDELGHFNMKLPEGRYELYFSAKGYESYKSIVVIKDKNVTKKVVLQNKTKSLNGVAVTAKKVDISKKIIRQVIEAKKLKRITQYSYESYTKSTLTLRDKEHMEVDSSKNKDSLLLEQMKMAEVYLEVSRAYPDKVSEKRKAVNINGNPRDFYYLSSLDGEFDFLRGLISVPSLGETPFLSPFSNNGLFMYRYAIHDKTEDAYGTVWVIDFKPNAFANNLLTGRVWIADKTWNLLKIEASFPNNLNAEYDSFKVSVDYEEVEYAKDLPSKFVFDYQLVSQPKYAGHSEVHFSKYEVDSVINKSRYTTELSSTTLEAYDQDSSFWGQKRSTPLSPDEIAYIHQMDSIKAYKKSDEYKDSLEQEINHVDWKKITYLGQPIENWRTKTRWYFPSLAELINPVAPGGLRILPGVSYQKAYYNRKIWNIFPKLSYGFLNKDLLYNITFRSTIDPIRQTKVSFRVGKSIDNMFWGDAFVNVLSRQNFYKKNAFTFWTTTEIANGLELGFRTEWARRSSLQNYQFYTWMDKYFYNNDSVYIEPIQFDAYNASVLQFRIAYTPRQMYVREPYEKIILGSKYPTFYVQYRKGVRGLFNSIIDYDFIQVGLTQTLNLGPIGISEYHAHYGNFTNEKNIEQIDYKRIARGNPYLFYNPLSSFQSVDSTFSLFQGYTELHYIHSFQGFLISKIPYGRYLKMNEAVGLSYLNAPEKKLQYFEFYAGLEKVVKILKTKIKIGVYGVSSFDNHGNSKLEPKFGISVYDSQSNKWR